ncbi:MAG TPA: hypothetical protein VGD78_21105 [Chthoniobacterales bacterium]
MRTWTLSLVVFVTALGGLFNARADDDREHGPHRHHHNWYDDRDNRHLTIIMTTACRFGCPRSAEKAGRPMEFFTVARNELAANTSGALNEAFEFWEIFARSA